MAQLRSVVICILSAICGNLFANFAKCKPFIFLQVLNVCLTVHHFLELLFSVIADLYIPIYSYLLPAQ